MSHNHKDQVSDAFLDLFESLVAISLERIDYKASAEAADVRGCYDRQGAADYLSIGTTKLDELRAKGLIKTTTIDGSPRFLRTDLDRFLRERRKE